MTSAYFALADLRARLGADAVLEIFDKNNDGTPDSDAIERFIKDCSSEVDSYLRPIYPLPLPSPPPNEVVRLALDVAEYRCARRYPEVVRRDWQALRKATKEDLESLRSGATRLDVPNGQTPDPPANVAAATGRPEGTPDTAPTTVWSDMGDF